jgi:uncharacterized protein
MQLRFLSESIQGPRQSGKTTLARSLEATRPYMSLDDTAVFARAVQNPRAFLSPLGDRVTMDEIEKAIEVVRVLPEFFGGGDSCGRFLLVSCVEIDAWPGLRKSLGDRLGVLTLWPFAEREASRSVGEGGMNFVDRLFASRWTDRDHELLDWPGLVEVFTRGGYPESRARTSTQRRSTWFSTLLNSIVDRDIPCLTAIESAAQLHELLAQLAGRSGTLLSFAELARSTSIKQTTLKRYVELLRNVFLLQLIPAWAGTAKTRLVKASKILLTDSGLQSHLARTDDQALVADPVKARNAARSWSGMELIKLAAHSLLKPSLKHFATHGGDHVDFVLEDQQGRVVGIVIETAIGPSTSSFDGLRALRRLAGKRFVRGVVLHSGNATESVDSQLVSAPLAQLTQG